MSSRLFAVTCIAAMMAIGSSCGNSVNPGAHPTTQIPDFRPWAEDASNGVGTVKQVVSDGTKGPVFVFEEYHTSRVGQLQIATMLLRLHNKHNLKAIGLEGDTDPQRLNAAWFQNAGGPQAKKEREDLGVRMLAEGEISSPEFLALEFPDVEVYGIEAAAEYGQELNVKGDPEVDYLIAIAEKSVPADVLKKVSHLLTGKRSKQRTQQAFDLLLNSDPWVAERYRDLRSTDSTSSEQMVSRIREIQAKATSVKAEVSPQAQSDLNAVAQFYETASQRSNTMVDRTVQLASAQNGSPTAMIIGAAHTDKVAELLKAGKVAFVVISPLDLNPKNGSLSVDQFDRKSKGLWARNSPGTLGNVLNHRKPAPVMQRIAGQSYASMNLAGMLIAKSARGGGAFPDNVWAQLGTLPAIRVDKDSIHRDGPYDVIFRAWLKDDQNREREVWARVGTLAPHQIGDADLERKLLDSIDEFKKPETAAGGGGRGGRRGGGIGEPPDEGPPNSRPAENEGPGDARRKNVVLSRTSMDTLAVFGSRREDVQRVGRISREI